MAKKQKTAAGQLPKVDREMSNESKKQFMDEVVQNHREFQKAQAAAKKAQGAYRSSVKLLKPYGINAATISDFIRDLDRDPEEVQKEIDDLIALRVFMGYPVGTQASMFSTEDDSSVRTAEHLGDTAAAEGWSIDRNPYDLDDDEPEHKAWIAAFESRQATMFQAANRQPAAAE